jgi:hypothetical protein
MLEWAAAIVLFALLAFAVVGSVAARFSSNPNRLLRFSVTTARAFQKFNQRLAFSVMILMLVLLGAVVIMRFVFHL